MTGTDRDHHVLQLSDLHLLPGRDGRLLGIDTLATFEAAVAAGFARGPVDAVVVSGDVAHDPEVASYRRAAEVLCRYHRGPSIWLAGNHDIGARMADVLPRDTDIVLGRWHVIGVDTHVDGEEAGFVATRELDRMEALLRGSPAAHVLAFGHHPCVRVGTPWLDVGCIENADEFLSTLRRDERIRAYGFGHIHHGGEYAGAPWPLLSAPATCFEFAQGGERFGVEARAPGCRRFTLRDDGSLSTVVVRADGFVVAPDVSKFR